MPAADQIATRLGLAPHPEGGFYAETFRSPLTVALADGRTRAACTAIFFLLTEGDFSAWHRVRSDELWHFYDGDPLELHLLDGSGHRRALLGRDLGSGQSPQAVVEAGVLQAARSTGAWSLVGCTVAPGFDFADFQMPSRAELLALHPDAAEAIRRFTR